MRLQAKRQGYPIAALWVAMLLWAGSFVAFKVAFVGFHPTIALLGRMLVASVCFLALFRWKNLPRWSRADMRRVAAMALFEPCMYFVLEAWALQNTTASQAGMVAGLLPLMVAVAAAVLLKERLRSRMLVGLVLAVAGVSWLSLAAPTSESAPRPMLGNLLELAAMLCATGYTILLKKLTARHSPLLLTGLQSIGGLLFFSAVTAATAPPLPKTLLLGPALAILYLGVAVSLGAYGLYNYAVSRMPAAQATLFVNLVPVFTVIMGGLILGERFVPVQYVASGLVLAGVFLSRDRGAGTSQEPRPSQPEPRPLSAART